MDNKELDKAIEKEKLNTKQPNYKLADLYREKIKRLGYGVKTTKDGSTVYKL